MARQAGACCWAAAAAAAKLPLVLAPMELLRLEDGALERFMCARMYGRGCGNKNREAFLLGDRQLPVPAPTQNLLWGVRFDGSKRRNIMFRQIKGSGQGLENALHGENVSVQVMEIEAPC